MAMFGYARVSTEGQTLELQQEKLTEAGAAKVYAEKESGAKTDRKELARAIAALDKGDVLLVTRLDRLARSVLDLLNVLEQLNKRKAGLRSLAEPWLDTSTAHGKLIMTVLAGIAEFERSLILARCNEGRVRAKRNGVKFGRSPKLTQHQREQALKMLADGSRSQSDIGKLLNVSQSTIARLAVSERQVAI